MTINPSVRDRSLSLLLAQTKKPRYYSSGCYFDVDDVVEADSVIGVSDLEDALDLIGLHQCLKNGIDSDFLLRGPIENVRNGEDSA